MKGVSLFAGIGGLDLGFELGRLQRRLCRLGRSRGHRRRRGQRHCWTGRGHGRVLGLGEHAGEHVTGAGRAAAQVYHY